MKYLKFKFKGNKPLDIVMLGDVHYGSKFCNTKLLESAITKLKKQKNTKIILMGDLIENASRDSVGSAVYEQTENPDDQTWTMAKKLKPLEKQILYSHRGNHEERSFRFTGFEIGQSIANYIGVPYIKNMAVVDIEVGKQKYRFFTWHGNGSSQSTAGRIKLLERQAETFEADAYFMGHVHELFATTIPKRQIIDAEFKDIFRHFVLTGAFLDWDESYAEMCGYKLAKSGCPKITLDNKQKKISVDLNFV